MPRRADTTLTDTAVKNLRPAAKRYEVRDAARPGFGVRVELDGRRVFFQRFGTRGERRLTLRSIGAAPPPRWRARRHSKDFNRFLD